MADKMLEKLMALEVPEERGMDGIDYPGLGFTEADAPSLLAIAMGEHLKESRAGEEAWDAECDAAVHAARALASLKNVKFAQMDFVWIGATPFPTLFPFWGSMAAWSFCWRSSLSGMIL